MKCIFIIPFLLILNNLFSQTGTIKIAKSIADDTVVTIDKPNEDKITETITRKSTYLKKPFYTTTKYNYYWSKKFPFYEKVERSWSCTLRFL